MTRAFQSCGWGATWGAVFLLAAALSGCAGKKKASPDQAPPDLVLLENTPKVRLDEIDGVALRGDVAGVASRFYTDAMGMSSQIAAATRDRAVREETLRWKIRMASSMDAIALEPDPRLAFVYIWLLSEETLYYLTEGAGQGVYGEYQDEVVALVTRARDAVIKMGYEHFDPAVMDAARDDIQVMARRQVLAQNRFYGDRAAVTDISAATAAGRGGDVGSLVLSPLTALRGIGDTPEAVALATREATLAVLTATQVIRNLPERTRWQTELLMYELEQLDTIQSLRVDADRLATTAERLTDVAQGLPDQLRQTLDQVADQQPELQKTLAQTESAAVELRELSDSMHTLSGSLEGLLADTTTFLEFVAPGSYPRATDTPPGSSPRATDAGPGSAPGSAPGSGPGHTPESTPDPDASPSEPVIGQLIVLAERLTEATAELRGLSAELTGPLAQVEGAAQSSIDHASANVTGLINAIAWRAAGLIVLFFVLLSLYRLTLGKRRAAG